MLGKMPLCFLMGKGFDVQRGKRGRGGEEGGGCLCVVASCYSGGF